ncbi:unnamed protein product [Peniophora sp. CBMAI 1063]|nr:unnamed protein product [Peniophora sp. CBMAI 1063]
MPRLSDASDTSYSSGSSKQSTAASSPKYWARRRTIPVKREVWQELLAKRPAFVKLDERFRGPTAPTLHFGITFTKERIINCARRHNLIPPHLEEEQDNSVDESRRIYVLVGAVRCYLERTLEVRLFSEAAITPGRLGIFALYSNHTVRKYHRRKGEKAILNSIRQELDIEKQRAAWYWDIQHGSSYVCEYEEFNL